MNRCDGGQQDTWSSSQNDGGGGGQQVTIGIFHNGVELTLWKKKNLGFGGSDVD